MAAKRKKHLDPAQEARRATLSLPKLDERACAMLNAGVTQAVGRDLDTLKARRDKLLIAVLKALAASDTAGQPRQ